METLQERLQEVLARGTWGRYRAVVEEMLDDRDPVDVAAAALAMVAARTAAASRRLGDGGGPADGSRPPEGRDGTPAPSEQPRGEGAVRERGSDDQDPRRRPKVVFRPNAGGPRKPGRPWKPGRPPARSFSGPPRDGGNPRQQQGRPFRGGRGAPRRPMNNG